MTLYDGDTFFLVGAFFPFKVETKTIKPVKIKDDPLTEDPKPKNTFKKVESDGEGEGEEADGSTTRLDLSQVKGEGEAKPVCRYGAKCYQKNPKHLGT